MKTQVFALLLLIGSVCHAQMSLNGGTVSAGGGNAQGGQNTLTAIIGQSLPAATDTSGTYTLRSGSMYQLWNSPPVIEHVFVTLAPAGQDVQINAKVTSAVGVAAVTLRYRRAGDSSFTSTPMLLSGFNAVGSIPSASVTAKGIEYFIIVTDISSNLTRVPSTGYQCVQVSVGAPGLASTVSLPPSHYRLVSVPVIANDATPGTILVNGFGPYSNTVWRFFELRSDQKYYEYPNTSALDPGRGFWLIAKNGGGFSTGTATSTPTSRAFAIPLNPGWTFIGDPFFFSVPLARLSLKSGAAPDIRAWNDKWDTLGTTLDPFYGYAAANRNTTVDTLFVDPAITPAPLQKRAAQTQRLDIVWRIHVQAECQNARDNNDIAIASNADAGLDGFDKPAPPPVVGDFVSVYLPHPEWGAVFSKYCTDVRPIPKDGEVWDMEVLSNIKDRMTLTFQGVGSVPDQFEVWLLDRNLQTGTNLRLSDHYQYTNLGDGAAHTITLVTGTEAFVNDKLKTAGLVPGSFELFQNFPNPFNPSTVIRYGIPAAAHVTLRVYNVLGQEVATLADEVQDKGFRVVEFNGRQLASGVYYYRLEARPVDGSQTFTQTRKLILLK
jgi:hypothetical protein